jgi:hypothetical protein
VVHADERCGSVFADLSVADWLNAGRTATKAHAANNNDI